MMPSRPNCCTTGRLPTMTSGGAAGIPATFEPVAEAVGNSFRLYGTALQDAPVHTGDMDALRAILYGLPSPGGRYDLERPL